MDAVIHQLLSGKTPVYALTDLSFNAAEYALSSDGNKISRAAQLHGPQRIRTGGRSVIRPEAIIRGDMAPIQFGKYCIIEDGAVIRSFVRRSKTGAAPQFQPIQFGDHVYVGPDCIIEAATVGSAVIIGRDSIVGRRSVLQDACLVLPGSTLAPETLVPPLAVFGGTPAVLVGLLPETAREEFQRFTVDYYRNFVPAAQRELVDKCQQANGIT